MNEEEQTLEGLDFLAPEVEEPVQPVKDASPVFAAPFGYKFGNSSVDLDVKKNHDTMRNEYRAWWDLPKGELKEQKQEEFSQNTMDYLLKKSEITNVKQWLALVCMDHLIH